MHQRPSFGSVFRRRRTGRDRHGARRTGHHPGWYVRYRRNGREITRYAGPERAAAEAKLERLRDQHARHEVLGEPLLPEISFKRYAREYLAYSRRDHSASTHRTRHSIVEGKLIPFFQGCVLAEIGPRNIERLLVAHQTSSPARRNRMLSALSAMFQRAMELGYVRSNPTRSCRRAREHATPLPLIRVADQERLIQLLPRAKRPLFLTALDTGARLGELLRLAWIDVDLDTNSLLLHHTKNGQIRVVRVSSRVRRALASVQARRSGDGDLVFGKARGADRCLRWAWRRAFKRAAAVIGQPSLRVHDLRHLAAINLIRCGVDLPTIQAHLGHKHLISTLRYAAYADRTASARAAEALDRLFGEPGTDP